MRSPRRTGDSPPTAKAAPGNAADHREFHHHRVHNNRAFDHHNQRHVYNKCELNDHHRSSTTTTASTTM